MEKLMKIGPLDAKPVSTATAADRKTAPARAGQSGTQTEASAEVKLSATAAELAGAATDPSFDAQKVERIAAAIRDGNFKVDAEKIADKLIANAQDLLKRYTPN
jgi:negative regulator of flagellin synthesis FlgM